MDVEGNATCVGTEKHPEVKDTVCGKCRTCRNVTWKERAYVLLMILSIVVVVGVTIARMATVPTKSPDFIFGLVLIVNAVFCIIYVIEGVLGERVSELIILCVATATILLYIIINFTIGAKGKGKLARLIVACITLPVLTAGGGYLAVHYWKARYLIRREHAWESQQILRWNLTVFKDILKFDVQLGLTMVILLVTSRLVDTKDIVLLVIGGAVTVAWFFLGFFSMSKELKIGAYIFFFASMLQVAYIIFKMYDVSLYIHSHGALAWVTIVCGALALVVRGVLLVYAIRVFKGFGKMVDTKYHGQEQDETQLGENRENMM